MKGHKYRIQYKKCGVWLNDITVKSKKAGTEYIKTSIKFKDLETRVTPLY